MKKGGFLSFLMVFCCTLATVILPGGCDDGGEITKLATPGNLKINGTTLTWNTVENALNYDIDFGSEYYQPFRTGGNSLELDFIRIANTYQIKVQAKAPMYSNYIDSDWSQGVKWERTPIQITVTFNTNGGEMSGDVPNISLSYGDPYGDLPADVTKTGYTFDGWVLESFGSYTEVTGESICEPFTGTTVTLTAKWTANKYTISFDLQGGDESLPDQEVTFGDPYGPLPTAAWGNNAFADWYTAAEGGTLIDKNTIVTVAGDHTLYAQWTIRWELTFNLQGGTGNIISPRIIRDGAPLPNLDASNMPSRTGYTFDGFYTEPNGGARYYDDQLGTIDETRTLERDTTLYAQWIPREYEVTLRPGHGNNDISLMVKYGQPMPTHDRNGNPIPIPSRPYYEFTGYFSSLNGYGTKYYDADMTPVNIWAPANLNSLVLYAGWQGSEYTIHLDPNGGALPAGDNIQKVRYDSSYKLPVPARTGYTFVAWRGYANNETSVVTHLTNDSGASLSPWWNTRDDRATLTAEWTANRYNVILSRDGKPLVPYTVSFNLNYTPLSGEYNLATPPSQTVTYDQGLTYPVVERRFITTQNYIPVFCGWYDNAACTGDAFDFTAPVTHNVILYAKWATFPRNNYQYNNYEIFTPTSTTFTSSTRFCERGAYYAFVSLHTQTLTFSMSFSFANTSSAQLCDSNQKPLEPPATADGGSSGNMSISYEVKGGVVYYFTAISSGSISNDRYNISINGTKTPPAGGKTDNDVVRTNTTYDANIPYSSMPPARPGYSFKGYFTELNGGGVQYFNANMTSARTWDRAEDDVILYAWWQPN